MSKNDILTEAEFLKFLPYKGTLKHIETYRIQRNLKKHEINILDWGCGRGREVLWLREHGYSNTYGIDIDISPLKNGRHLFKEKGYDEYAIRLLCDNGKTDFPDNFFHFTFSNQVFEHIQDIESTAAELKRITKKNGMGYHVYPANRHIVECHLSMPFVHWLPKNKLRKLLMTAYAYCNILPSWDFKGFTLSQKVNATYEYSINKTYYKKYCILFKFYGRLWKN